MNGFSLKAYKEYLILVSLDAVFLLLCELWVDFFVKKRTVSLNFLRIWLSFTIPYFYSKFITHSSKTSLVVGAKPLDLNTGKQQEDEKF